MRRPGGLVPGRGFPLAIGPAARYMQPVTMQFDTAVTMAINGVWNKRCGPGGGTRRLHHSPRPVGGPKGAKQARRAQ